MWFITGAGRGMGADFAKAALAAGHVVVATGRNTGTVSNALGQSKDLLAVTLDATKRADAEAAVRAAVDRFIRRNSAQTLVCLSHDFSWAPGPNTRSVRTFRSAQPLL